MKTSSSIRFAIFPLSIIIVMVTAALSDNASGTTGTRTRDNAVGVSAGALWIGPLWYVNDSLVKPAPRPSRSGYRDTAGFSSAPNLNIMLSYRHFFFDHFMFEGTMPFYWQNMTYTYYSIVNTDQVRFNFTYGSLGGQFGFYGTTRKLPLSLKAGLFGEFGYSWLTSKIDSTSSTGTSRFTSDFWGTNGSVLGLNGDKLTNYGETFAWSFGVKSGVEYRFKNNLAISVDLIFRYCRALIDFLPDFHLWENTESYKDIHVRTMLNRPGYADTTLQIKIVPSMLGGTLGLSYYF
jgi:hypothetical protein